MRNRMHFYRVDFGVINGYKKSLSKNDAIEYFKQYSKLNIIHHKTGYWERITK